MNEEKTKSFAVSKRMVYNSYLRVKEKGGSAGIDRESIGDFEREVGSNLYKIWNRMASGSYFPPPVRTVPIPKKSGGKRLLGIPTVGDRIAQGVVKEYLEPELEEIFHNNSFGYRPKRSAHQALKQCHNNCLTYPWVIDVDIKGFFDHIDHDKMMELLNHHTDEKWILLYVNRWLKAGVLQEDGGIKARTEGTPQGGVISPLLANLYLHHAFDSWMEGEYGKIPFERYADDIVIHCVSLEEAQDILKNLHLRMKIFSLELNSEKTRIVYCKNYRRTEEFKDVSFTFLGYTFRPRGARNKFGHNRFYLLFYSSISTMAIKSMHSIIRKFFKPWQTNIPLATIGKILNPKIRGWVYYYGLFSRRSVIRAIEAYISKLLLKRLKSLFKLTSIKAAVKRLHLFRDENPKLFYHWL